MEKDAGPARLTGRDGTGPATPGAARRRRRWLGGGAALLTLASIGISVSGYLMVDGHRAHQADNRDSTAALAAAKDCVAATQPADLTALPASQHKLDDCATGEFGKQAAWYSAILTEAYQAQNVHVALPEMHAGVERTNDDGSIIALVIFRADISQQGVADRENSYRIRVKLVRQNGQFKVAQLDQVSK